MKTSIDGKIVNDVFDGETLPVLRTHIVPTMVYRLQQQHMIGELKFTKLVRKGDGVVMLIYISGLLIWWETAEVIPATMLELPYRLTFMRVQRGRSIMDTLSRISPPTALTGTLYTNERQRSKQCLK